MATQTRHIDLPDERATQRLAQRLAPLLSVGDCLLLSGEIGAGKSFFARAVIRALTDEQTEVPSPAFTIVQTYQTRSFEIWHCDLYRLSAPEEALELGLQEAFETAVTLIEWPDRLEGDHPSAALELTFAAQDTGHCVDLTAGQGWLERLAKIDV